MQRDPAGVPAHHLDDEHPVVRLGRRVQPVDRVDRDLHGGVEAERVVGGVEVVVDGLRYADDVAARARASCVATPRVSSPPMAISASTPSDSRFSLDPLDAAVDLERVGAGRAEDGAAARQDAADRPRRRAASSGPRAGPSSRRGTRRTRGRRSHALADDGPDHRVETGAVATAGQHPDPHAARAYMTAAAY